MTPVIGFHSVILKPDSVSRVTPPTTMIAKTKVAEPMSHPPTAGGVRIGMGGGTSAVELPACSDDDFAEECKRDCPSIRRMLDLGLGAFDSTLAW